MSEAWEVIQEQIDLIGSLEFPNNFLSADIEHKLNAELDDNELIDDIHELVEEGIFYE